MTTLTITALRKTFRGVTALQDLSIIVEAGVVLGVMGPNGSGKTTLLDILSGVLRPDSGTYDIEGFRLAGKPPYIVAAHRVGRTFQDPRVVSRLSVRDNIALAVPDGTESIAGALFGRRRAVAEVLSWADEVGLASIADVPAYQLSYGQRKLLSIATCLAREPRVILLDEPIAGLQDPWRERVLDIIRSAATRGAIVIAVEHDLDAVRAIASRVAVLRDGRLVREFAPTNLTSGELFAAYAG